MTIQVADAKFFGMDGYAIDKNNISKISDSIYEVYIDYSISGATKVTFNNTCIVQRDTSIYQLFECKKDKNGNYIASYMKMDTLINVANNTSCILSVLYYDSSDVLLQSRAITTQSKCQWERIFPTTSLDVARQYILNGKTKGN